jgi:hypothetical protein
MQDYEKLGVFYLGKTVNPKDGEPTDDVLLYESKNLTTHAVCLGMTGSGKTGLGIATLEEAAIDKIPAIIIDPKGDLSNLLLTFPHLSPEEFLPWIDEAEAERKGQTPKAYATTVAKNWKDGLAKWGEDGKRIQNLRSSADMVIYTPASNAGIPLSILSSFAAPPKELLLDSGAMRDRIMSVASSLLGLLGINADPIKSREHILISTLIDQAWRQGQDLDIAALVQLVQKPPFDKIGALDLETFFPNKDRLALSISINNLLASPGFQAWMEGEPLDIQRMLYTTEGKPKLAIISIAHLSDSERMFFVTLLLNEFLAWMRRQSGTSSLRALLYMDEIFGYFPPSAMPPCKTAMLTLLKQARAFGVGIILATQNPVDLDYKGLSNCGTWFIGKLQTERDRARVLEGLQMASNGDIDSKTLEKMLATTGNRTFVMRSVHEKDPILFQTRWTLSYLRGPLTLAQISALTPKPAVAPTAKVAPEKTSVAATKPVMPSGISELFVRPLSLPAAVHYIPKVVGMAKLHYVDAKNQIDEWRDLCLVTSADDEGKAIDWQKGINVPDLNDQIDKETLPNSTFAELPAGLMQEKNYALFEKAFAAWLYQNQTVSLYRASEFNLTSNPNESEGDFRARLTLESREKRDSMIQKLRDKYADKMAVLTDKIRRAQDKVAQKQQQASQTKTDTLISIGSTLLGAIFGRGVTKGTITQTGTSIRRATRMEKDGMDISAAEEDLESSQQKLNDLHQELDAEISKLTTTADPSSIDLETITIRPRKSDISVEKVALLWWPT